ncbi:MAG: InlB B-repeat-containing protein [Treponema sp.]|jgi:uncharacterized repeat protein (TIGR02543 family)|nr:InlB B-repeat-containing protein [Treponema sp.]
MRTIKKSLFPIIALCAVIGLLVTACKDEDDPAPPAASTTFTVTFDKNEGTTDADPTTKTVTAPATTVDALPTPPARTDYLFDGWNTQADGEGEAFTADTVVTASITVYAQWTTTEVPATYTVTFDKNEGTTDADPTTKTVTAPATTVDALPTPPARTDYLFDGWNTQANGEGEAFTADTVVTASITVYAQWTADERIVLTVETDNVPANAEATDADVEFTFTGTAPTGLTKDDFIVTGDAEIKEDTDIAVDDGESTVTVTITFAANPDSEKTYTVGINPSSTVIKGSDTVTVTQAAE